MPEHHQVKVVRIPELLPHPNADTLSLVKLGGYQLVVKTSEYAPGDLAIFVPPDSVVPDNETWSWLWDNAQFEGGTPIRKRLVRVRKFRKEYSEGLLQPVSILDSVFSPGEVGYVREGQDVAKRLGITHYDPEPAESARETKMKGAAKPKSLRGWMFYLWYRFLDLIGFGDPLRGKQAGPDIPYYDVEAYKNFVGTFQPGEEVVVSEKLHGSNARYIFLKEKMHAGSRQLWKAADSPCVWRWALRDNPWIEDWCRAHEGYALYGEVFPTQKFEDGSRFHYGVPEGKAGFAVFDILKPNREWANWEESLELNAGHLLWVPWYYFGPFDEAEIKKMVDGKTYMPGADHIREGIVIKSVYECDSVHGLGRKQLKLVSNDYLEKS